MNAPICIALEADYGAALSVLQHPAVRPGGAETRSLGPVLDEMCRLGESLLPDARCSVMLHEPATGTLRHGAAPSMPGDFNIAEDHLPVAVGSGASGTAVATGQPVLLADVPGHPYTARLAELVNRHTIGAAWSVPLCVGGTVMGVFTTYFAVPRTPTAEEFGRSESLAKVICSILEQHAAREAEAERETSFRTAAALLPAHMFIIKPDGQRLYANPYHEKQTGISADILQGDGWRAALHPDDVEDTLASYFAAMRGGQAWERRFRIRMEDGAYRWFMSRVRPQYRADGTVAALVGVEIDVHDLVAAQRLLEEHQIALEAKVGDRTRALEQTAAALHIEMEHREAAVAALVQSQKIEALGRLTGGVAHGFNNLLSAIMGGYQLIAQRTADPDLLKLTRDGLRACDRAAAQVRQLLTVARTDPPKAIRLDIAAAVPRLRDLVSHALPENIEFDIAMVANVWPVLVDPLQFETSLLNLALNARDAMPCGGRVTMEIQNIPIGTRCAVPLPERDFVVVRVADTGCGMTADIMARIFEPFFTTKRRSEGTGLGLATVDAFIHHADGEVAVDSVPGRGTIISLYLPRDVTILPQEAGTSPKPVGVAAEGARVLMVDDDDDVRSIAATFLRDAGYIVSEAPGAAQAMKLLRAERMDLVVTDLAMPDIDGVQLAAMIRAEQPRVKVMFVSGYAEDYALSGEVMLQKPYGARTLLEAVAGAVRG